jgi:hypothetical protein
MTKVKTQQVVKSRGHHWDIDHGISRQLVGSDTIGAGSPYCPRQSWK